jgi:hypothetical protein
MYAIVEVFVQECSWGGMQGSEHGDRSPESGKCPNITYYILYILELKMFINNTDSIKYMWGTQDLLSSTFSNLVHIVPVQTETCAFYINGSHLPVL